MTAVLAQTTRDQVTVTGSEAAAYLQGQLSQDVTAMAPGESKATFVLAPQGKVEGWGRIQRRSDETFVIDVDPGAASLWEARLTRFLLRTKAEITVAADVTMVSVRGPDTEDVVAQVTGEVSESGWLEAGWPGVEGKDLLEVSGDELDDTVAALVAAGAQPIDAEAFEALRIRSGVPRWGAELNPDTIPAAAGEWVIEASVSFTKGCYTGQELVARVDSRGNNVPRRLAALVAEGEAPSEGDEVTVDGKVVGQITSSAADPVSEGAVALTYVARSVSLPATAKIGDRTVELASLPIAGPVG